MIVLVSLNLWSTGVVGEAVAHIWYKLVDHIVDEIWVFIESKNPHKVAKQEKRSSHLHSRNVSGSTIG